MPLAQSQATGATRPLEGYAKVITAATLPTDVATGVETIAGQTPQFGAASAGVGSPTQAGAFEEAVLFELRQMVALLMGIARGPSCGQDYDLHKTSPTVAGTTGPGPSGVG